MLLGIFSTLFFDLMHEKVQYDRHDLKICYTTSKLQWSNPMHAKVSTKEAYQQWKCWCTKHQARSNPKKSFWTQWLQLFFPFIATFGNALLVGNGASSWLVQTEALLHGRIVCKELRTHSCMFLLQSTRPSESLGKLPVKQCGWVSGVWK